MLVFDAVEFPEVFLHRVGNKQQESGIIKSNQPLLVDEQLHPLLAKYFLKPFQQVSETYEFTHHIDEQYHPLKGIISKMLENDSDKLTLSHQIADHLYNHSNHPHIKEGDLFIVPLNGLEIEDRVRNAIGIFKSENKESFLKTETSEAGISLSSLDGINISKLDKGCLVILEPSGEFTIYSKDQNNYDTQYWNDFLGVQLKKDHNFETKAYLDLCKNFSEEVIKPNSSKKEQVDFLNESVKFFQENEQIETKQFENTVLKNEQQRAVFKEYQNQFEAEFEHAFSESFPISQPILQKQKKKLKNEIKLDTNIQIKLDFNNPESSQFFIEQGYDDQRGMKFYKVYFNQEIN